MICTLIMKCYPGDFGLDGLLWLLIDPSVCRGWWSQLKRIWCVAPLWSHIPCCMQLQADISIPQACDKSYLYNICPSYQFTDSACEFSYLTSVSSMCLLPCCAAVIWLTLLNGSLVSTSNLSLAAVPSTTFLIFVFFFSDPTATTTTKKKTPHKTEPKDDPLLRQSSCLVTGKNGQTDVKRWELITL